MASGRLGQHKSSGSGVYDVYTVPASTTAEVSINVFNNTGSTNKVTLFRSPAGTPSATHTIQLDKISINSGYERTALVLKAGEVISYRTDGSGTNVVVSGNEYSSNSNEISEQNLITTNTETSIYLNTVAKAGTVNISVSLVDGSAVTDGATCKLYVSSSNAAGGYQLHYAVLSGNGTTGFERTALPVSATDKIILVTTGIVGQIATTISGYTKG